VKNHIADHIKTAVKTRTYTLHFLPSKRRKNHP
jgi:hypothetical protein